MKTLKIATVFLFGAALFISGCYTQFSFPDRNKSTYEDRSDSYTNPDRDNDSSYNDEYAESDDNPEVVNNYYFDGRFTPNYRRYFWGYQPSFGFGAFFDTFDPFCWDPYWSWCYSGYPSIIIIDPYYHYYPYYYYNDYYGWGGHHYNNYWSSYELRERTRDVYRLRNDEGRRDPIGVRDGIRNTPVKRDRIGITDRENKIDRDIRSLRELSGSKSIRRDNGSRDKTIRDRKNENINRDRKDVRPKDTDNNRTPRKSYDDKRDNRDDKKVTPRKDEKKKDTDSGNRNYREPKRDNSEKPRRTEERRSYSPPSRDNSSTRSVNPPSRSSGGGNSRDAGRSNNGSSRRER